MEIFKEVDDLASICHLVFPTTIHHRNRPSPEVDYFYSSQNDLELTF